MKYDLKKPCKTCPFVRGHRFPLRPDRVEEIRDNRGEFPCHNTVDYDAAENADGDVADWRNTSAESHCLGHLIVSWAEWGGFNQLQAMAARCGDFDPHALPSPEEADVFDTWGEMVETMEELEG